MRCWKDENCSDSPISEFVGLSVMSVYRPIKKIRTSDNTALRSFSIMCAHEYGKILSKYSIHNLWSNSDDLKSSLWRHFVDTAIFYQCMNCNFSL